MPAERRVEIKFCGLTCADDAALVGAVGGAYAGVIFAGGPRRLDPDRAARVLAAVATGVRRVGVFGDQALAEVVRTVRELRLDVVQLHGDPAVEEIRRVRGETGAHVWAVVRVGRDDLAARVAALDGEADAILLDTWAPGRLGGTGVPFDWSLLTPEARPRRARLVAAGGLTPENVAAALGALGPDIVDVSSGVERSPGIKDPERMRAFADAVRRYRETP